MRQPSRRSIAKRLAPKTRTGHSSCAYDVLERLQPSPIVPLNRAVAVAMVEGPRPALALIDELAATGELGRYHLLCTPLARIYCGSWGCQRMLQPATSAPLRS